MQTSETAKWRNLNASFGQDKKQCIGGFPKHILPFHFLACNQNVLKLELQDCLYNILKDFRGRTSHQPRLKLHSNSSRQKVSWYPPFITRSFDHFFVPLLSASIYPSTIRHLCKLRARKIELRYTSIWCIDFHRNSEMPTNELAQCFGKFWKSNSKLLNWRL